MRNFLPFGRSANLVIPAGELTAEYSRPRRIATKISDLGTGGYVRAHLQDVMISIASAASDEFITPLQMRMGIYGQSYLTEDFYDYKVYEDGVFPSHPVWNWGKPYRLHPGEYLRVQMGPTGPEGLGDDPPAHHEWWPMAGVQFNGVKVETGEPSMLYDIKELAKVELAELATTFSPLELGDVQLDCPKDSAIDLYSMTLNMMELNAADAMVPRLVFVKDHNDRSFWMRREARGWIQLTSTPILLGEEWTLTPNETITFEFQPYAQGTGNQSPLEINVLLRGAMEVEDGR